MLADLQLALRTLLKNPIFTLIATLTLALCIGANTAVFSVVDAILLRPLPFPEPDRLFAVITKQQGHGMEAEQTAQTGSVWEAIREGARDFDAAVFTDGAGGANLIVNGSPRFIHQQRVSSGFFRMLDVAPRLGREFNRDEDRAGGPPAVILSDALWRTTFHSDPAALGSQIHLHGELFTVVGIMPPSFRTSTLADLWTSLQPSTSGEGAGSNYHIALRLHPGISRERASAELRSIGASLFREKHLPAGVSQWLALDPLQRSLTSDIRKPILILWCAVLGVLLIGCVNIAGLLLARSATRAREIGTRLALGAHKAAILRQLLTESLVLAALGSAAGFILGAFALAGLKHLDPASLGIDPSTISLNTRVLFATALLAILTSLLFGLYPALQTMRVDIRSALSQGGSRGSSASSQSWSRRALIVGEVALSTVLLLGAGLLLRTFIHLVNLDPGFDSRSVVTASLSLRDVRYKEPAAVDRFYSQTLDRIRTVPGVESAGIGLSLPYTRALNTGFSILDGPHPGPRDITNFTYVTPGYFETLRMNLLRGRFFRASDNAAAQPVAIVNEAFANKFLNEGSALGRHLDSGEVVGVVGNVQESAGWGDFGPLSPVPEIYVPVAQMKDDLSLLHTWFSPVLLVRSHDTPNHLAAAFQSAVASVDPLLPIAEFHSMDEIRSASIGFQRLTATLLGILSGLALALAAVGIYGLIANSVVERSREVGIRMALGATIADAVRAICLPGILLSAAGLALGCLLGAAATRLLHSLLFGVKPNDPLTFALVGLALLLVACIASILPGLRAARIDPAETLRAE